MDVYPTIEPTAVEDRVPAAEDRAPAAEQCPVDHAAGAPTAAAPAERTAIPATELPEVQMRPIKQILSYWKDPYGFMEGNRERYGKRFSVCIRLPVRPMYVLHDQNDMKQMFLAPADVLHTGTGSATIEKFTGQTGLAWLDEDEHKARRKVLMPSMHGKALQRIEAAMAESAKRDVASWPRGKVMPLHPYTHRLTLNVIREVIYGPMVPKRWDELADVLTKMMDYNDRKGSALRIHEMPARVVKVLRAIRPLGLDRFLKLRDRADVLIAESIAERRQSGELGDDMLSMLLGSTDQDGNPLSGVELRDEMMTIFLAGTETTASGLAFALEVLSRETEARERLVAEIDKGESDEYLTATVHEVLRLRPPIPNIIFREVMKPVEIGGVRYEPGMLLWASAHLLHQDPAVYPDPTAFRPERFLNNKPNMYSWIPFGGGRIRCLGAEIARAEMKCVLREVLTRCELFRDDPEPETVRSRIVLTQPSKKARVGLHDRTPVASAAAS
jgi:cytochrome P450